MEGEEQEGPVEKVKGKETRNRIWKEMRINDRKCGEKRASNGKWQGRRVH
jgi:hypothetical protein